MNKLLGKQSARLAPAQVAGRGPRRRGRFAAALTSLSLLFFCSAGLAARADSQGQIPVSRHHVIFLVDASGSVDDSPGSLDEYRSVIRTRLPALLADAAANGFGVSIYDPGQDFSSAFAFGLSRQRPYFAPSVADGFMRRLWFQEQGRTCADLSAGAPVLGLHWTAINSAFIQGVRKARWEAEQGGALDRAFERTFLVVVSDGRSNTTTDSLDEMSGIRGAARGEGLWSAELEADYAEAQSYTTRLTNLFTLRATDANDPGQGGGSFNVGNYKVFIRELRPHRLVNLNDLVKRPDQETQLGRRAGGTYVGTLSLTPHEPRPDETITYELVGLKYRLPGQHEFRDAEVLPSPGSPFAQEVALSGDEIDQATAAFQVSFMRRDPLYGQAVQTFEESVRFRREPRRYVLGLLPITDFAMKLHPGLSQDQIVVVDSILLFAAGILLIYVTLFPAPRAEIELSGKAAAAADAPLLVAFSREGQQREQQQLLRTLHLKNNAFRKLPLVGRMLPRIGERRFDIQVGVRGDFPQGVRAGDGVIGLGTEMHAERLLKRQTEGSQISILLSPEAVADYNGRPGESVKCALTVQATQTGRKFGVWRHSRRLQPQTESFYLRFEPEEPDMQAALVPRLPPRPTGETETRPFPQTEGVAGWLILPHYQGRRDEPEAGPEFELQVGNDARHACSRSGSVKLSVTLSRADGRGQLVEVRLDNPYEGVLSVEAHRAGPLCVPVWLPYEKLPLPPGDEGDDYVLAATLTAAEGQQWAPQTVRYGVRLGPDPRRTALSFRVTVQDKEDPRERRRQSFGSPADGATLKVAAPVPVHWNVGQHKETPVFAVIEIDNVARNGDGHLTVWLKPGAQVSPHPDYGAADEPAYAEPRHRLVKLLRGKQDFPLGKEAQWRVENEAGDRPVRLRVEFQPYVIQRMERRAPLYAYVCHLPFECVLRETADGKPQQFAFSLQLEFEVQRYSGDHALAIDFGTSAVVTAFEESEQNIKSRPKDLSNATQHLQERYQQLLKVWSTSPEPELKRALEWEAQDSNPEHATAFIPSPLLLREGKQLGDADFTLLPATLMEMSRFWDRAVYYLKGLILRGDEHLPYIAHPTNQPLSWKDHAGNTRKATRDPLAVDEIIRSAYRNLFVNYIEPLLDKQKKLDYLDRLVVAHPNNFTLSHIHRMRKLLDETFPQFSRDRIHLLSESNAVAIYCARNAGRFFKITPRAGEQRHLLVYDIGAGTVDLTYTRLEWDSADGASKLKEMKVLFKSGLAVAGNRLDECLARILDAKIHALEAPLAAKGITLKYNNHIVDPEDFDPLYQARMMRLKLALQQLKIELSEPPEDENRTFNVRIAAAAERLVNIATISESEDDPVVQQKLAEFGVAQGRSAGQKWISIPLTRQEIYGDKAVKGWLDQVTDGLIRNLAGALKVLGIKPEVDTLILSGRTAEFPPLRRRLSEAIRKELGLDESGYFAPALERNEKKEAVALGSLLYAIFHGRDLRLTDRNIWAKYGVIYNEGGAQRFREFFGYASTAQGADEEVQENGMRTVFFRRTLEIVRTDGPLEIAATFSYDPDADLRDPQAYRDRFQVIHTVGANLLGPAGRLKVEMSNNRDDTITLITDPDGFPNTVKVRGYRPDAHIVQLEWPYQPLKS